jgi:hypothetical protein
MKSCRLVVGYQNFVKIYPEEGLSSYKSTLKMGGGIFAQKSVIFYQVPKNSKILD